VIFISHYILKKNFFLVSVVKPLLTV